VDLWQQMPPDLEDTFWFSGQRLNAQTLQAEFTAFLQAHRQDWQAVQQFIENGSLGDGPGRDRVRALDALSITDYLQQGGVSSALYEVIKTAYSIKYGVDAAAQSSLNLLCYFRQDTDCESLFGASDERFYLQGGNAQLPAALFAQVRDRVHLGTALEALEQTADGQYRATLRQGQTVRDRYYQRVVLTLPFSVLRHLPLRVELPAPKRQAIQELGYNSPTKLIAAYRHKPWHTHGSSGLVYTDLPIQHCWEASDSFQSAQESLLVVYPSGAGGQAIAQQAIAAAAEAAHADLHQIFPNLVTAQFSPDRLRSEWFADPFSQGAYSCYQVGQWTTLHGWEGQRVGNLHFAGEHCSRLYQGYMEGACETAEQVVLAILTDSGKGTAAQQQRSRLHHYQTLRSTGFTLSS
jgi:monoamine oxidase